MVQGREGIGTRRSSTTRRSSGSIVMAQRFVLQRKKWKPGQVVQRFGDWTKGEPCVIIPIPQWQAMGSPEQVKVEVDDARPKT